MDIDDFFSLRDSLYYNILTSIINKRKLKLKTIKANQYKHALSEFVITSVSSKV